MIKLDYKKANKNADIRPYRRVELADIDNHSGEIRSDSLYLGTFIRFEETSCDRVEV